MMNLDELKAKFNGKPPFLYQTSCNAIILCYYSGQYFTSICVEGSSLIPTGHVWDWGYLTSGKINVIDWFEDYVGVKCNRCGRTMQIVCKLHNNIYKFRCYDDNCLSLKEIVYESDVL